MSAQWIDEVLNVDERAAKMQRMDADGLAEWMERIRREDEALRREFAEMRRDWEIQKAKWDADLKLHLAKMEAYRKEWKDNDDAIKAQLAAMR